MSRPEALLHRDQEERGNEGMPTAWCDCHRPGCAVQKKHGFYKGSTVVRTVHRNWSEWVVWKVILGKLPCHLHADHYDKPRDRELEELDPESRQGKRKKIFWTLRNGGGGINN